MKCRAGLHSLLRVLQCCSRNQSTAEAVLGGVAHKSPLEILANISGHASSVGASASC